MKNKKILIIIGILGILVLMGSIGTYLYVDILPKIVRYGKIDYGMEFRPVYNFFYSPSIRILLISSFIICVIWLIAWKVKNKLPFIELLDQISKWGKNNSYIVAGIISLIYFLFTFFYWLNNNKIGFEDKMALLHESDLKMKMG